MLHVKASCDASPLNDKTDIENSTNRIQSYTVTRSRDQSGT